MIKEYLITYEKKTHEGRYITATEQTIRIPALTLFDALDYAYNNLELEEIKEVKEVFEA